MDIEDFRRYLVQTELPLTRKTLTIKPYLSIERHGKYWYVYGICVITASFCDEVVIEWYRGKSEVKLTLEREERAIEDLIHLNLDDIFTQQDISDIEYVFKPAVEITWASWDLN